MQIIILAGGSSTRFYPLTDKTQYRFLGKSIAQLQIKKLRKFFKSPQITLVAGKDNYSSLLDVNLGVNVILQQGEGQKGAVLSALAKLESDGDVLIINLNDFFEDVLLKDFINNLKKFKSSDTNILTGYFVKKYFPGGYLDIDENDNVKRILEKPGIGNEPSDYVRLVFDYFVSGNELKQALKKSESKNDDEYEVAITDMIKAGSTFQMQKYAGRWATIKYPWHILEVMNFFLESSSRYISKEANISKKASINGNVWIEDGVKIYDGAVINGPVYLGKNTVVGNNALVRNSIIGENCVVGFGSEVARSYLSDSVWLHKNYVGDSVIEENVSFGSNAVTANLRLDEREISVDVKGEKIGVQTNKLGVIIAKDVRIGVGVLLMPGITIASNSVIGSGVVLSQNIDTGSFVGQKSELIIKKNTLDISKINRNDG